MKRPPIRLLPSQEELHRLFSYDPVTGVLTWKVRPNPKALHVRPGKTAGFPSTGGHLVIVLACIRYYAHRVIWKMVTGDEPDRQVDHIDGDKTNNRWANLRLASHGQNRSNAKAGKNNKSGVKGVCWDAGHQAWLAYVSSGGKQTRIGRFKSLADAASARREAADLAHGEFVRHS